MSDPVSDSANDRAGRLHRKAEELRTMAARARSHAIRTTFLCLADDYEKLSSRSADGVATDDRRATADGRR